jgi:hypothetical protein
MAEQSRFASEEVKELLVANGLCNLETAFELGEPVDDLHQRRASRHQFKRVVTLELNAAGGPVRVYIKRQTAPDRWLPRLTDLRHGFGFLCTPINEWRGLRTLKGLGLAVAEPLAVFWQGWGVRRGAVVTRAVPPKYSLSDLIVRGELDQFTAVRRESLIEAAILVIERLHRAGLAWRSMKPKHFYPEQLPGDQWRIWLIDCEGVYRSAGHRGFRRGWRDFLHSSDSLSPSFREAILSACRGKSIVGMSRSAAL